jgi:hypothetical protein
MTTSGHRYKFLSIGNGRDTHMRQQCSIGVLPMVNASNIEMC